MTPEDLAERHPVLFHLADAGAWDGIKRNGLLSAAGLLALFEVADPLRTALLTRRRAQPVTLTHDVHGRAVLGDNGPLSETKLARCLEGGLKPSDWIAMLNARIFFWASATRLRRLRGSALNAARPMIILTVDTLSLGRAYLNNIEISPINSGATVHLPARRGSTTFTPLGAMSHQDWRRQRGQRDTIAEVVVTRSIPDIEAHVIRVEQADV